MQKLIITDLCFFFFLSAACSQSYCSNARCTGCFVFLVVHEQGKFASFAVIFIPLFYGTIMYLNALANNFLPYLITLTNFQLHNYMNMQICQFSVLLFSNEIV